MPDESVVTGRLNWLRAGVLGANDGIISISALVIGVAAAAPENHGAILTAGVAGLAAGALSMCVSEYVSVSAQRDAEREQLRREEKWHEDRPDWELEQLVELNMATGMTEATARAAAREQTDHDPLAIHARMHLNIDPESLTSPLQAGIASLIAFTLGGIGPLLMILLASPAWQVPVTYLAVVLALAATGIVSARLGHFPRGRSILRNVVGGSAAMGIGFLIGQLLGVAV